MNTTPSKICKIKHNWIHFICMSNRLSLNTIPRDASDSDINLYKAFQKFGSEITTSQRAEHKTSSVPTATQRCDFNVIPLVTELSMEGCTDLSHSQPKTSGPMCPGKGLGDPVGKHHPA